MFYFRFLNSLHRNIIYMANRPSIYMDNTAYRAFEPVKMTAREIP